jgi:GT2 family glycosyltransferase/ubiquinone/menaquinone biosynthesis C-methylase UbiE
MTRVTASVIAWNDRAHLLRCLESLRAQEGVLLRIVVVDNASRDGSAEAVREGFPEAMLLSPGENLGYAGAHNLAFSAADDPFFLALNADVRLDPGYAARLVQAMESDPGLGSASGKLLRASMETSGPVLDSAGIAPDARGRFRDLGAGRPDDGGVPFGEVFGVCGAAALYRRAAILDSQPEIPGAGRPFDAAFFAYYEDADLACALARRGWRAQVVPEAVARHVRGGSNAPAERVEALLHRNAFFLLLKHGRLRRAPRIAPGLLAYETAKLAQALLGRPWLRRATAERVRAIPAMLRRRRALAALEARPRIAPRPDHQRRERAMRDAQAPSYERIAGGPYHEAVEIASTLARLDPRPGERIVDLGCGTGRLTARIALAGARAVGADFSFESLREARRLAPDALLVQADCARLPFAAGTFDRAVSSQVFHHLPDAGLRRGALGEAARVLRKEGVLVLTAYHDAVLRRPLLAREGFHPGGIFYHRFRPRELARLVAERFEVAASAGLRHLPARSVGERAMRRRGFAFLGALLARLDRRLETTPLSPALAHLWLVKGVKKGGEAP